MKLPRLAIFVALVVVALPLPGCSKRPGADGGAETVASRTTSSNPATPSAGRAAVWNHEWIRGAVFYEVFVRSFEDSNGDGIGDLPGLISKLDYLNDGDPATASDLGVDALWLMPVFASPSYHGYDVTDYETINPEYGTNQDFARLVEEAHRRGIKVILDLVINHTSAQHPWFVASASSPRSPKRDWYVWRADDPGWTQPWGGSNRTWHERNGAFYYGIFWGGMPDLNFRNPEVRAEAERIAKLWLDRGVDGFRLDAARHMVEGGPGAAQNDTPETHAFWKEFSAYVRSVKPEAVLVGENWSETAVIATYFGSTAAVPGGDELPMNFDFPLADAIVQDVNAGDGARIAAKIAEVEADYPPGVEDATFLTNHDMVRLATQLGNDPGKLRSAAAVLLTLPGSPFVYYGEEVGLGNGPTRDDESKRTPMPWNASSGGGFTTGKPWFSFAPGQEAANVAAETGDRGSLLSSYRSLVRARRDSAALRLGAIELLSRGGPVLAYVRAAAGERVLVVHNLGAGAVRAGPFAVAASATEPLLIDSGVPEHPAGASGAFTMELPPHASGIWRLR
ncbi:MAG: alpha-amylase [Acidobacteriia bacterium]|nr:alpha-amylase [Terriglobia bacterium]